MQLQGTVKVPGELDNLLSCVQCTFECQGEDCITYPSLPVFMTHTYALLSTA